MYDRIVLPVDGSDEAMVASDHAIDLADKYDATLHVLHVVDTRPYDAEGITPTVLKALETRGEQVVESVAETATDRGVDRVETAVIRGEPHETILEYVEDQDVDLLVMATHGRTGVKRYVLGSVTEKTIRTAPVPVHVVRVTEDDAE